MIDAVGEGVAKTRVGERVWVYLAAWQRRGARPRSTRSSRSSRPSRSATRRSTSAPRSASPRSRRTTACSPTARSTASGCWSRAARAPSVTPRSSSPSGAAPKSSRRSPSPEKAELASAADVIVNYREDGARSGSARSTGSSRSRLGPNLELARTAVAVITYAADTDRRDPDPRADAGPSRASCDTVSARRSAIAGVSKAVNARADHAAAASLPARADRRPRGGGVIDGGGRQRG